MTMLRRFRVSLATLMMLVVTIAAASALFAKIRAHIPVANKPYLKIDAPLVFVASIALTAVALAALKSHTANQTMVQATIAYLGYLSLIGLAETGMPRPLLYWFQVGFCLLVTLPLLARKIVKSEMERGPRRRWWKNMFESLFFAFLTMMLVLVGIVIEFLTVAIGTNLPKV
ncbi:MAG: hypothetical protein JWN86_2272 [Planctomycetota bacterium]|nr:hypothetical protein [Planctomycetota bacterium]